MSERQYAAHVGLSRGAIQKAKMAERLVLFADGSINAAASDVRRSETTDPSKTRKPPAPKLKPVPEAAVAAVGDTLREQGLAVPAVGGGTTFLQAKTANEVLKAQERRIRLQKLKGELIERARALALVFRLAREERDAWVNWPARAAALMAAELSASFSDTTGQQITVEPAAMQKVLEKHVRAHLEELAEVRPDFR
ncbi:elements of external origin [Phenylobacterium sp.]|nr:elements of external origin [Phenylobacterium sp.]